MSKFPMEAVSASLLLLIGGIVAGRAVAQENSGTQQSKAIEETKASGDTIVPATEAIGLLDVGYIFKNYPWFLDAIAEMKLDVVEAEGEVNLKKQKLANLTEQLKIHPLGTEEHTTLEDQITVLKNELASDVERRKRDFLRREAQIYYEAYQKVLGQSEQYARQNGIVMVLRVDRDPTNVNDPQSILKLINKPIVWYDQQRDMTEAVLQRLVEQSKEEGAEPKAEESKTERAEPADIEGGSGEPAPAKESSVPETSVPESVVPSE